MEDGPCAVGRGVVHHDEFGDVGLLKDLADDGLDSLGLVVNGHDDRKTGFVLRRVRHGWVGEHAERVEMGEGF